MEMWGQPVGMANPAAPREHSRFSKNTAFREKWMNFHLKKDFWMPSGLIPPGSVLGSAYGSSGTESPPYG